MLVLSRKLGESIIIDNNITVTVVELCGSRVRLGIEAPQEVPIRRSELDVNGKKGKLIASKNNKLA